MNFSGARRLNWIALGFAWMLGVMAAEPEVDPKELVAIPPTDGSQAVSTFKVKPGFRIELVASEPLVRDPIEICFDEDGRMFVVEMIDYSELRDAKPHLGRIRRLEDRDGDGRYDHSVVFADDLPWPTGVFCSRGGVYAAATPDLFFLADTNRDGRADVRQLIFSGFGIDFAPYATNKLNMQAMVNSLRWGLDHRIHGVTGPNGGELTRPGQPNVPSVNVRGYDFAFDPLTHALTAETGGGQYGMSFNDRGVRFTCNNSDHLRVFMYDRIDLANNPHLGLPPALESIAADGPAAEVFRRSPDEPWRVVRTRWRVAGLVPGPVEGGGRASGYFTSATGIMVYRGSAWPESYVGDVFIADCGSNLIHRKRLRPRGVGWVGERPPDEQGTEFLTSSDIWFRPVQMANAPDGALYIVDMYREIIEHPWSLPPTLKKHLDLNRGSDRGRIYRVVPDGFRQTSPPRLSQATTAELVGLLEHRNAWHRETASRLLHERQDRAAVSELDRLLQESVDGLARMHALWVLDGLSALTLEHIRQGLRDADERVREQSVKLAARRLEDGNRVQTIEVLRDSLLALAKDPSPYVRYQLAFALHADWGAERWVALAAIAKKDAGDPWVRAAVLSAPPEMASRLWAACVEDASGLAAEGMMELAQGWARILGASQGPEGASTVLAALGRWPDAGQAFALAHALGQGWQSERSRKPLPEWDAFLDRAALILTNRSTAESIRVKAAELLGLARRPGVQSALWTLLAIAEPQSLQVAAIRTLARLAEGAFATNLLQGWDAYTPRVRDAALEALLARPDRALELLEAVVDERVRRTDLSSVQIQFLTSHRDQRVREAAARSLRAAPAGTREEVLERFRGALELVGDPARGKAVFVERCASCHRLGGEGHTLGPDLVSARNAGKEKLLTNIVDPNREVLPQYLAYELDTRDEESYIGLIVNETATSVTLRQPYGQEQVVPRARIAHLRRQLKSIMPEELEAGLDVQAMADLLEFAGTASADGR